jgi:hypothetical protein
MVDAPMAVDVPLREWLLQVVGVHSRAVDTTLAKLEEEECFEPGDLHALRRLGVLERDGFLKPLTVDKITAALDAAATQEQPSPARRAMSRWAQRKRRHRRLSQALW